MSSAAFVVPLRDLEDAPRTLQERLPDAWLRQSLAGTDVEPAGEENGQLDVTLTKNGREVLVQGEVAVSVVVPCARTLDPARYRLEADVFLMLSPSSSRGERDSVKGASTKTSPAKTGKKGKGKGRGSPTQDDLQLSHHDAAQDVYQGDRVVLDDFLREFILLEVPMVPLREDLRSVPFEGNPSPPGERPPDPRLSPLADLKARLEKKE